MLAPVQTSLINELCNFPAFSTCLGHSKELMHPSVHLLSIWQPYLVDAEDRCMVGVAQAVESA